jgi:hypothetical protein
MAFVATAAQAAASWNALPQPGFQNRNDGRPGGVRELESIAVLDGPAVVAERRQQLPLAPRPDAHHHGLRSPAVIAPGSRAIGGAPNDGGYNALDRTI